MQAARESWQRLTYFLYWYYCLAHIDSRCFAGETFLNRSIFCSKIRKFVDLQFATRIYLQFFSYLKHIEQTSDYFKISAIVRLAMASLQNVCYWHVYMQNFVRTNKKYITWKQTIITDSVRCVVGVRCQAITQVKQLFAGSVLGWVTAGPRPAHPNAEREVITVRLETDSVKWSTVAAQVFRSFPVPSCKCDTA